MDFRSKDEIMGMLLDRWIADLRQEQAPQVLPELQLLAPEEIEEVMELARWYKASFYPSDPRTDIDRFAGHLRSIVREERAGRVDALAGLIEGAPTFGALVRATRDQRAIDARGLERALAVPEGKIRELESGTLSPCRLPMEKMVLLLRGLQLASGRVIDLIRRSSAEWAQRADQQPQTQLGRVDLGLNDDERRQVLAVDGEDWLTKELGDIEQYCQELAGRLR